jgi:adenosine deaminase
MARGLAELHVHLEGTLRETTARVLAARHGLPPPPPYEYADLDGFLAVYAAAASTLRDAEDVERAVLEHARDMRAQGIDYAEVSINPALHPPGTGWQDGLGAGRGRARDELGVEIRWLVELVRGAAPSANAAALELALATEGVCGVGLVGDERISAAALAPLFARARSVGLGVMPHAGQTGGPAAVREAVELLGASRLAHGVAAASDPSLLAELAERGVGLCVCPSSNHRIGLHPDFAALARAGVAVTVNTDDPAFVGTTLRHELEWAERELGWRRRDLVDAAWRHRFGS